MIAMTGRKVSTVPTPTSSPSTSRPRTQLSPRPAKPSSQVTPEARGPLASRPIRPCSGAANLVVSSNSSHTTARNTGMPAHGLSRTVSTRSEKVRRRDRPEVAGASTSDSAARHLSTCSTTSSTQANSASAWVSSCAISVTGPLERVPLGTGPWGTAVVVPQLHDDWGGAIPVTRLGCAATSSTARARSPRSPSVRLRASTGTTGTPSAAASAAAKVSGSTPAVGESVAVAARSSMVSATTRGTPVSATWPSR